MKETKTFEMTHLEMKELCESNYYDAVDADYSHICKDRGVVIHKVYAVKW